MIWSDVDVVFCRAFADDFIALDTSEIFSFEWCDKFSITISYRGVLVLQFGLHAKALFHPTGLRKI